MTIVAVGVRESAMEQVYENDRVSERLVPVDWLVQATSVPPTRKPLPVAVR